MQMAPASALITSLFIISLVLILPKLQGFLSMQRSPPLSGMIQTCPCPPRFLPFFLPNSHRADRVEWVLSPTHQSKASATWNAIKTRWPIVHGHKMVWFCKCIPRHSVVVLDGHQGETQNYCTWE